jgi:hypothetical protein
LIAWGVPELSLEEVISSSGAVAQVYLIGVMSLRVYLAARKLLTVSVFLANYPHRLRTVSHRFGCFE